MRPINKTAWKLMLIEGTRALRNNEKISWTKLCRAHHVSTRYATFIPKVLAKMQISNMESKTLDDFYQALKNEVDKHTEKCGLTQKINPHYDCNSSQIDLTKVTLENLIKEINNRGFKIYQ